VENSESVDSSAPGPGEILRSAREALGISQREMADRLNWIPGFVAAIEENRFEVLRGAAFVRGYLRAYAKLVQVPEESLMEAYAALPPQEQSFENKRKRVESRVPQVQKKGIAIPAGAALVVLVVVLLWYWRGVDQAGTAVQAPTAIEHNEVDTPQQAETLVQEQVAPAPSTPGVSLSIPGRGIVSDSAGADTGLLTTVEADTISGSDAVDIGSVADLDSSPSPAATGGATSAAVDPGAPTAQTEALAATAADVPVPEPGEPVAEEALQFRFSGDCWLEVRNADGELIYADLRRDGEVLNLSGQAPFSILLGDATVVELDYLGQPVVIERRPGRVIATFSVGEE
jgi:cytoskeleton protein RodZ